MGIAVEKPRKSIDLRKPLYDNDLEYVAARESYIKELAEELSNEEYNYDLHIHIDNVEMVPTALAFSMSKRHNVDCHAYIGDFEGNYAVYSFLADSSFMTVNLKGN